MTDSPTRKEMGDDGKRQWILWYEMSDGTYRWLSTKNRRRSKLTYETVEDALAFITRTANQK